jgi:hypothetical protein
VNRWRQEFGLAAGWVYEAQPQVVHGCHGTRFLGGDSDLQASFGQIIGERRWPQGVPGISVGAETLTTKPEQMRSYSASYARWLASMAPMSTCPVGSSASGGLESGPDTGVAK